MSEPNDRAVVLEALKAVMQEIEGVKKDGHNDFHKYNFVSEAGLVETVRPAMLKHGLFLIGPMAHGEPTIDTCGVITFPVEYELAHESGAVWPSRIVVMAQGCDRDSKGSWGDKGAYKAHTGAHKYALMRLLNLVTGLEPEHDSEGQRTTREAAAPPARSTAGSSPSRRSSPPSRPEGKGGGAKIRKGDMPWPKVFQAAEKVYGKDTPEYNANKFAALDGACEILGVRRWQDMTYDDLEQLEGAIDRWTVEVLGDGEPDDADKVPF